LRIKNAYSLCKLSFFMGVYCLRLTIEREKEECVWQLSLASLSVRQRTPNRFSPHYACLQ